MRLAVVSDIHGNYKALEAFLEYMDEHPADGIIALGDYVTDSPYPERTMKLIYDMRAQHQCVMLRGNREEYLIQNNDEDQGWKPSSPNGALYYTAMHMTDRDIAFFKTLPTAKQLAIDGCPKMTLCHGTPKEVRGNMEINAALKDDVLRSLDTPYLLGGHSHHQERAVRYGKTYVNPGSLGLSIDGLGRHAQFAVLTGTRERWDADLISIPYDADSFLQDFTTSGLDEYGMILTRSVKKTLISGVNYFYRSIQEAQRLCGLPLAQIPEEVWQEVAVRLAL